MSKLTGAEIVAQHKAGRIILDPFNPHHVGPNSVDVTLSNKMLWYPEMELDMKKEPVTNSFTIPEEGWQLKPGHLYIGCTNERAGSDHYATTIAGRSSVGRLGIFIHVTAGFGDIGFKGRWTLEIVCIKPVMIYPNVRIAQVAFDRVEGQIDDLRYRGTHGGRYQGEGPEPSRFWKDFKEEA